MSNSASERGIVLRALVESGQREPIAILDDADWIEDDTAYAREV